MFGTKITKIKVGGMMCDNCVKHVREALERLDQVKGVDISLKEGIVAIKHKDELDLALVEKAVVDADYQYGGLIQ